MFVSPIREPLIQGHKTYAQMSDDIIGPVEAKPKTWMLAVTCTALLAITGL